MSTNQTQECPLCMEILELDDLNFFPCSCKYQVCRFCWNHIITSENGLCPACRRPYNSEEPASFKPMSSDEIKQMKRKHKGKLHQSEDTRKDLADKRVVQPNLLFVVNLPQNIPTDENILKGDEYFGKYGVVQKIVVNHTTASATSSNIASGSTATLSSSSTANGLTVHVSAYVTYRDKRDALIALLDISRHGLLGVRSVKASLGTTKYCAQFLRGASCGKKECMYLHQRGDDKASFTKEDMTAGKHTQYEQDLVDEFLRELDPATLPEGHFLAPKPAPKPLLECGDVMPTCSSVDEASSVLARLAAVVADQQTNGGLTQSTGIRKKSREQISPPEIRGQSKSKLSSSSVRPPQHLTATSTGSNVTSNHVQEVPLEFFPTMAPTPQPLSRHGSEQLASSSPMRAMSSPENLYLPSTSSNNSMSYYCKEAQQENNHNMASLSVLNVALCSPSAVDSGVGTTEDSLLNTTDNTNQTSQLLHHHHHHHHHTRRLSEDDSWLVEIVTDNLSCLNQMAQEEQQDLKFTSSTTASSSTAPLCGPPPGFEEATPTMNNGCGACHMFVNTPYHQHHHHHVTSSPNSYLEEHQQQQVSNQLSNPLYFSATPPPPITTQQPSQFSAILGSSSCGGSTSTSSVVSSTAAYPFLAQFRGPTTVPASSSGFLYSHDTPVYPPTLPAATPPLFGNHLDLTANSSSSSTNNPNDLTEMLKTILPVDATLRFGAANNSTDSMLGFSTSLNLQPTQGSYEQLPGYNLGSSWHPYSSMYHGNAQKPMMNSTWCSNSATHVTSSDGFYPGNMSMAPPPVHSSQQQMAAAQNKVSNALFSLDMEKGSNGVQNGFYTGDAMYQTSLGRGDLHFH